MPIELADNRFQCDGEDLNSCIKAFTQYLDSKRIELLNPNNLPKRFIIGDEDRRYLSTYELRPMFQRLYELGAQIAGEYVNIINKKIPNYNDETKEHILNKQISSSTFNFYELDNFEYVDRNNTLQVSAQLKQRIMLILRDYLDINSLRRDAQIPDNIDIPIFKLFDISVEDIPSNQKAEKLFFELQQTDLTLEQMHDFISKIRAFLKHMRNIISPYTQFFLDLFPNLVFTSDSTWYSLETRLAIMLGRT